MQIIKVTEVSGGYRIEFKWTGRNAYVGPAIRANILRDAGHRGENAMYYQVTRRAQVVGLVQTDVTYFLEPIPPQPSAVASLQDDVL